MPARSALATPSVITTTLNAFAFPWQGAVLVLCLTAGAAVRQHPTVLRPFVQPLQVAALGLIHMR